jgi:hypothetical protein
MAKTQKRAQPASSTGPIILIAIGVVLILIVLILSLLNVQAGGTQANGQAPAASDIPYPEIDRVSLSEALTAFNANTAIFVDVRSAESFNQSRIPGAVNIPLDQIETTIPDLERDAWIILYCT